MVDPTLQQRYTEASTALHQLRLGKAVVKVVDQNGESVTFQSADRASLEAYVNEMAIELGISSPHVYAPMRFIF